MKRRFIQICFLYRNISPTSCGSLGTIITRAQGRCYAANSEVYSRIADTISNSVISADLEFNPTNELGRVNRVDPMGITDLRIRGLWQIQHPIKVFGQHYRPVIGRLGLAAIMLESKYDSYPIEDRKKIEDSTAISLDRIKINDPNNPANKLDAVLLSNSLRLSKY